MTSIPEPGSHTKYRVQHYYLHQHSSPTAADDEPQNLSVEDFVTPFIYGTSDVYISLTWSYISPTSFLES